MDVFIYIVIDGINEVVYLQFNFLLVNGFLDKYIIYLIFDLFQVIYKFIIIIISVDDEIFLVINNGFTVQEGVRKLIIEFELKVLDKDIEVSDY